MVRSHEAGVELLKHLGVKGRDKDILKVLIEVIFARETESRDFHRAAAYLDRAVEVNNQ